MHYDIVIIGAGVAGMTAGLYAGRTGKSVLIIENYSIGGYTAQLKNIVNYPGYQNIDGIDLTMNLYNQTIRFGVEYKFGEIEKIDYDKNIIIIGNINIEYKALIIASGISAKKVNCKNELKFKNKGISYCAICDGNLYSKKSIICITNNNSGKNDIEYLNNLTDDLIVLNIGLDKIYNNGKEYCNVSVESIGGESKVSNISFVSNGKKYKLECDAVFVSIGKEIDLKLFEKHITTKNKYIVTDENMKTNIHNVFAAGDIRYKKLRQIITACSDGAIAATSAIEYISKKRPSV